MSRIGRYDNPYAVVDWDRELPSGTRCEPLPLPTADRAMARGWLYARGGEDTVVCAMHPRADFSRHYVVPGLVDAGFAVLCVNSRWLNNDSTLVHERVLLDVAAGVAAARARYERVVLLGNSGGASLFTFYLSQALAPEGGRLRDTAAGDPLDLHAFDLPAADAMIYLAGHPGEGHFLLHAIDPSVTDEDDPLSCDAAWDPFDPAHGFAEPPAESRYTPAFLAGYRAAQRRRVERLDALARARVARRRAARERARAGGSSADRRAAMSTHFLHVYRTDADPRCVDLSLDASKRDYGSLFGRRPDLTNYGAVGFARMVSPEAWLSTWSGLSSRAEIAACGSRMTLPALLIHYEADNSTFPSDAEHIAASLGTSQLARLALDADHYGFPSQRGREPAIEAMASWLRRLP